MPAVSPVSASVAVFVATGPWQVLSGPVSAWYHHWAVWFAIVSVAPVAVMLLAVRLGGGPAEA